MMPPQSLPLAELLREIKATVRKHEIPAEKSKSADKR